MEMREAAKALEFEKAAKIRDKINAIKKHTTAVMQMPAVSSGSATVTSVAPTLCGLLQKVIQHIIQRIEVLLKLLKELQQ